MAYVLAAVAGVLLLVAAAGHRRGAPREHVRVLASAALTVALTSGIAGVLDIPEWLG